MRWFRGSRRAFMLGRRQPRRRGFLLIAGSAEGPDATITAAVIGIASQMARIFND